MPIHRDLPDAELHEAKGAASATAGQILTANGLGIATFQTPTAITFTAGVSAVRSTDLNPVGVDNPVTAAFDANVADSDVSINTAGTITILTTGVFHTTFNLNFGRTPGAGTAVIAARLLLNGAQFGFTQTMTMSDATNARPSQFNIIRHYTAGDVLQVQVMRDSSGINNGGLLAIPITPATWGDTPAYWVRVTKLLGAL